jgi:NAD(P)-dependent dehydrogenase (short-subunit alcohol dehydrogenase family)
MSSATYDYDDETVIVTGGSSGIGRAIARRFGAAGATVINADLDPEPKDLDADRPTHVAIEREGGDAAFVETDVSDPAAIQSVVEAAREEGGVDVMVNNAGIFQPEPVTEITEGAFDALFGVNVKGVAFGTRAASADMLDRDAPGVILNTASISSDFAQPDHLLYDATKGAIRIMTRVAAYELAEHDIRVNAIAPGAIATEIVEGLTEEQRERAQTDDHVKAIPMGRAGEAQDCAGPALFLASDDAGYVTGELLYVDGGWHTY